MSSDDDATEQISPFDRQTSLNNDEYNQRQDKYRSDAAYTHFYAHFSTQCETPTKPHYSHVPDKVDIQEFIEEKKRTALPLEKIIVEPGKFDRALIYTLYQGSLDWITRLGPKKIIEGPVFSVKDGCLYKRESSGPPLDALNVQKFIVKKVQQLKRLLSFEIMGSAAIMKKKTTCRRHNLNETIEKRANVLRHVTFFSLVFGHWSNHGMYNYLGVTLVTYNEKQEKLTSFLIRITDAYSPTAIDICNQLNDILEEYEGLKSLIVGLSTDNASNMVKVPEFLKENDELYPLFLGRIPRLLHSTNHVNECLFDEENEEYTNVTIIREFAKTKEMETTLQSLKSSKDLTPAIKESAKIIEFDTKILTDNLTMIDDLLHILEPFQYICELLSSDSCTVKGALPLLEFYHILLKENVIKQFKKGVVSFPERTVLIKCLQKMEKYYKIYRSNDFRLMG